MRFVLLTHHLEHFSNHRLIEAAEARGHQVIPVDATRSTLLLTGATPEVHVAGEPLTDVNAVIARVGASSSAYGIAVLRHFEMQDVVCVSGSLAIARSRDKLRALQILSRRGVQMPFTAVADHPSEVDRILKAVGRPPYVIKVIEGSQGLGVVKADSESAARSVIEALQGLKAKILVQEFIAEAEGADLRCFVVKDKVVASMRRQGAPDDFRSNLHRGGSATSCKLTRAEREMAVKAAKAMGLSVAGVDLLQSHRGPLVMEVNSSPGLEGIERATGIDVASKVIEHVEQSALMKHRGERSSKH